jgi:mannose-6-phosphate isomerase-like protein (cupin superfamily)
MIETFTREGRILALVVRAGYRGDGIQFFTPDDLCQQLGYMRRPAGHLVEPHVHRPLRREIVGTSEVLFIRSGRARIDLYDEQESFLESVIVGPGDVVLLSAGGHGLEMLEECEIIEVKQGPYHHDLEKSRFRKASIPSPPPEVIGRPAE